MITSGELYNTFAVLIHSVAKVSLEVVNGRVTIPQIMRDGFLQKVCDWLHSENQAEIARGDKVTHPIFQNPVPCIKITWSVPFMCLKQIIMGFNSFPLVFHHIRHPLVLPLSLRNIHFLGVSLQHCYHSRMSEARIWPVWLHGNQWDCWSNTFGNSQNPLMQPS